MSDTATAVAPTQASPLAHVQLYLVDSVEMAGKFLTWLGTVHRNNVIGIDIETGEDFTPTGSALSPFHGQIRLIQVGDTEVGWAIPWDDWVGVFYEAMKRYDGMIVCHNISFEALWFAVLSKFDVPWHLAHDTMLMSRIINPTESAKLKDNAARYVDPKSAALQETLGKGFTDNGWTWGTVPITFQPYWAYGALDPVITCYLFDLWWPLVQPGGIYAEAYELEMSTQRIATRMEFNGARVDLAYSQKKLDELDDYTQKVRDWAYKNYGGISITSNIQLAETVQKLGGNITDRTPTGQPKMAEEQLLILADPDKNPPEVVTLVKAVLAQRKAAKLAKSYFSNFIEDNVDGFVHPSINTMGARTGRMSITKPALQTLPSGDAAVRRAFIPRFDDWGIISSDLDQVEFRLTANLSNDEALIALFLEADATGGDVFTSIMREVYQDTSLQKSDARRKLIKGVVYGKLYGAGVDKMATTAGVDSGVMKGVVDGFDNSYPGVKALQRNIENLGEQRLRDEGTGYVNTRTGRRLPADGDRIYSLTNYLIQASAAEVFKQNLIKLDQQDLTEFMIVPVHDEIVMNAPLADVKEVMETVQECMTTRDPWRVPLTSGVEGPFSNWGQKYEH